MSHTSLSPTGTQLNLIVAHIFLIEHPIDMVFLYYENKNVYVSENLSKTFMLCVDSD